MNVYIWHDVPLGDDHQQRDVVAIAHDLPTARRLAAELLRERYPRSLAYVAELVGTYINGRTPKIDVTERAFIHIDAT